jgi:cytoskeletal protein CcmA (bactofilin family)
MDIRQKPAVIGKHLKIVGNVVAEERGVELNGQLDGEIYCGLLVVSPSGRLSGKVTAKKVVVRGSVEGPIFADELVLAAGGEVKGDVICEIVVLEKGAFLEGRISHDPAMNGRARQSELPAQLDRRRRGGEPQALIDDRGRPGLALESAQVAKR